MDKNKLKRVDRVTEVLGDYISMLIYWFLCFAIAKSNMKAFWKVTGITLAMNRSGKLADIVDKKIKEYYMSDDNSIEYVKKVK